MINLKNDEPCPHCGRFANRGISIDAVIIKGDEIALVKRGGEPFKDWWAIPGGYINWDESAEEAVKREVKEETNLEVTKMEFVRACSLPERHIKQTITLVYLVEEPKGKIKAGDDAAEAKWVPLTELPEELAFDHKESVLVTLEKIKNDKRIGRFENKKDQDR